MVGQSGSAAHRYLERVEAHQVGVELEDAPASGYCVNVPAEPGSAYPNKVPGCEFDFELELATEPEGLAQQ